MLSLLKQLSQPWWFVVLCALSLNSNASATQDDPFMTLPADIHISILSATSKGPDSPEVPILDIKDLGRCAQVSRAWRQRSSSDRVWQQHYTRVYGLAHIPVMFYQRMSATFSQLTAPHSNEDLKGLVRDQQRVRTDLSENPLKNHGSCSVEKAVGVLKNLQEGDFEQSHSKDHAFVVLMLSLENAGDKSLVQTYLSKKNVDAQLHNKIEEFRAMLGLMIARGSGVAQTFMTKLPPSPTLTTE